MHAPHGPAPSFAGSARMPGFADRVWTSAFAARTRLAKPAFARETRSSPRALWRRALGRALAGAAPLLPFPPARAAGSPPEVGPLPRTVWMYWDQGEAAAPGLVRLCIASWRRLNPGWEVRVLDRKAAAADLDFMPEGASLNHLSDALRLALLDRHGGVWADATCLCARPLDGWLPAGMGEGFLAFARPTADRPVASWFLAAAPGAPLIRAWNEASRRCWSVRGRADHYFVAHYLFEWMLLADRGLAEGWARIPAPPAAPAHRLQDLLRAGGAGADAEALAGAAAALGTDAAAGGAETVPVHKLDWRIEEGGARLRAVLAELRPDLAAALADAMPEGETA